MNYQRTSKTLFLPSIILGICGMIGAGIAGEPKSILFFSLIPAALWCFACFNEGFNWKRDAGVLLMLAALFVPRMVSLPLAFGDYKGFLLPWFERFKDQSFSQSMQRPVTNYMVLYEYFIYLISRLPYVPLELYKLFSISFEALLAWACGKLACREREDRHCFYPAFLVTLALPTVFLNSAVWAQCDVIYTALALAGFSCFLEDHPYAGSILFSMAFGCKLQSIFLFPILLVLMQKRKCTVRHMLILAASFAAICLPALAGGRTLQQIINTYVGQMGEHSQEMVLSAPTVFQFINGDSQWDLTTLGGLGISAAFSVMAVIVYLAIRSEKRGEIKGAFLLCICIPFLLPHMHERYFFLAEALSIPIAAGKKRGKILVPALQIISMKGYLESLFEVRTVLPWVLFSIGMGLICTGGIYFLYQEGQAEKRTGAA